jgi:hypothetical protein
MASIFLGECLFIAGHNTARVFTVVVALTTTLSSPASSSSGSSTAVRWLVPSWLAVEFLSFQVVRWREASSWRYLLRNLDSLGFTWAMNLGYYLVVTAMPSLWWRSPFFTCPHLWTGGIVGATVSNFALMGSALHFGGNDGLPASSGITTYADTILRDGWAFPLLGACVGVSLLGFSLVWTNMVPAYRPTFYRRDTHARFVEHMWHTNTMTGRHGYEPNDSKAQVLKFYANRYWPRKELVTSWLRDNWDDWMDTTTPTPKWFNKKWRRLFPKDWLPSDISNWGYFAKSDEEKFKSFKLPSAGGNGRTASAVLSRVMTGGVAMVKRKK